MSSNINLDAGPFLQCFCRVVDPTHMKQLQKVANWSRAEVYVEVITILSNAHLFLASGSYGNYIKNKNKKIKSYFKTEFIWVHAQHPSGPAFFWDTQYYDIS